MDLVVASNSALTVLPVAGIGKVVVGVVVVLVVLAVLSRLVGGRKGV